jgi:hypothetical protein
MKRLILLAAILPIASRALCQDKHELIQSVLEQTKSSSDRKNWAGLLSGFLNGTGQDKQGTITIHPTLYFLSHACKILHNDTNTIDNAFSKQTFIRNTQLDLGFTPDNNTQLKIDNSIEGFTIALLSNKQSTDKINRQFDTDVQNAAGRINFWGRISQNDTDPTHKQAIANYIFQGDTTGIMAFFPKEVNAFKQQFRLSSLKGAFVTDDLVARYSQAIKKQPLWTISGSHNYGFVRSHTYLITASTTLQLYLSQNSTITFDGSYTWGDDTTKKTGNYGRRVWSVDAGPDFKFTSWFELKPTLGFSQVATGSLYKNEHQNTPNVGITPSVKVTDKLWLPITIKYDPWHGQLFGLLSVQYSLK